MSEAENPPAFPSERHEPIRGGGSYRRDIPGMSLRDWFAGQALALAMLDQETADYLGLYKAKGVHEATAKRAYDIADAMLSARHPTQEQG